MTQRLVRRWEARAPMDAVAAWLEGFRERVLPRMKGMAGCLGVSVQVSDGVDPRDIVVLTYWNGSEALAEFAGPDRELAVMPDWVARLLPDHDRFATHYAELVREDFA